MKNTIVLALFISFAGFGCKSSKSTSANSASSNVSTSVSSEKSSVTEMTETNCPVGDAGAEDPRLNYGGYSNSQTSTNFQGASGSGTGSSYASNYYAREKSKQKESKICTTAGGPNTSSNSTDTLSQSSESLGLQPDSLSTAEIIPGTTVSSDSTSTNEFESAESSSGWITDDKTSNKEQTNVKTESSFDEVSW